MTRRRVAIVGGGITGLSAARQVAQTARDQKLEIDILLFESSSRIGGKVITYREDGFTLEGGPDSILARKMAGSRLLKELGLESEIAEMNTDANQTFIVRNGKLESMPRGTFMGIPGNLSAFLENRVLTSQGKVRALTDLLLTKSDLSDDVSLGSFLRERLGDEWVERLAEPLLAGIYAGQIDTLSLRSTWAQFEHMANQYRSLIIGARAMRKATSASAHGRSAFITVKGGLYTVIERLADSIADHVNIHLEHDVVGISKREDGTYTLDVRHAEETRAFDADAVIVATPVHAMKRLLTHLLPSTSQSFDVPYASTATVILGYPTDHVKVDLTKASGFLVPRPEGRAITASTWVSSKWPHAAPSNYTILRCYVGRMGQTEYLAQNDADLAHTVQQDVRQIVGIEATPTFHKVTRWEQSMPNYPVGHQEQVKQLERDIETTLPGIYVGGAGYHGIGLPDCIVAGEAIAAKVCDFLTNTPEIVS